jgi:exoribonuclease R
MAAAQLMIDARIGIVRTLPPSEPGALHRLRRTAQALHLGWPSDQPYPEFVRSLDPAVPAHAAMLNACAELFRGAGYAAFDSTLPEHTQHAALATDYAHATAPLRRLVDRYAGEVCVALCAGRPVPEWVMTGARHPPDVIRSREQATLTAVGVTDDDREDGLILTCQAKPTSRVCEVRWDD